MRRLRDVLTLELFAVPQARPAVAAGLDLDVALREALADAIKHCDRDRYQVAAEMSRLTGREISKFMLDAYTGDSRQDHNFPLRYAAAFEAATGSYALTQLLAKVRGCTLAVGDEAVLTELGRLDQIEAELKKQRSALKHYLSRNPNPLTKDPCHD